MTSSTSHSVDRIRPKERFLYYPSPNVGDPTDHDIENACSRARQFFHTHGLTNLEEIRDAYPSARGPRHEAIWARIVEGRRTVARGVHSERVAVQNEVRAIRGLLKDDSSSCGRRLLIRCNELLIDSGAFSSAASALSQQWEIVRAWKCGGDYFDLAVALVVYAGILRSTTSPQEDDRIWYALTCAQGASNTLVGYCANTDRALRRAAGAEALIMKVRLISDHRVGDSRRQPDDLLQLKSLSQDSDSCAIALGAAREEAHFSVAVRDTANAINAIEKGEEYLGQLSPHDNILRMSILKLRINMLLDDNERNAAQEFVDRYLAVFRTNPDGYHKNHLDYWRDCQLGVPSMHFQGIVPPYHAPLLSGLYAEPRWIERL